MGVYWGEEESWRARPSRLGPKESARLGDARRLRRDVPNRTARSRVRRQRRGGRRGEGEGRGGGGERGGRCADPAEPNR